jgi:predicted RNA binding protein YcfA (HicA-like mRNA interferase family)
MKLPRDVYGRDLATHLIRRWGFRELRQTGSHIILRTEVPSALSISIPAHKPLRLGTLSGLLDGTARGQRYASMAHPWMPLARVQVG